ncbi:MAG: hypothetical protein N2D54_12365, partial [Chloroflexota bacterium]
DKNRAIQNLGATLVESGHDFDASKEYLERELIPQGFRYVHSANEPMLIAILFLVRLFTVDQTFSLVSKNRNLKVIFHTFIFLFLTVLITRQFFVYQGKFIYKNIIARESPSVDLEMVEFLSSRLSQHPAELIYATDRKVTLTFYEHALFPQREMNDLNFARGLSTYPKLTPLLESGRLRFIILRKAAPPIKSLYGNNVKKFKLIKTTAKYKIYRNPK